MVVHVRNIIFSILSISLCLTSNNSIHVITTNDLHGSIDEQSANFINPSYPPTIIGGSGFLYYVNNLKEELNDNPLLILDGGNIFQGHPIGIVDSGRTIIKWMNKIGYHAMVPGNYDFLFGIDNLIKLSENAEFSFLASNLYYENNNELIFKPYEIFNLGDVTVGIIGLINPNLENIVLPHNLKNIVLKDPIFSLKERILEIRNKVDIVLLLTSAGVPWDREDVYKEFINKVDDNKFLTTELNAIELGYFASGVDVVISGGISKGYPTPFYDPYSHIYTFQNYGGGTSFGHFIIQYDNQSKLFTGYESAVKNQSSQTLFLNDFLFDESAYDWIKNISYKAYETVYQKTDWDATLIADGKEINTNITLKNGSWNIPTIDKKENLDIITWNCEFFPTAGDSTILALTESILDLNPDIIAFQEIKNRGWFGKLMNNLLDYDYIISQQSSFMDQAIIYKKNDFSLINRLELFAEDDYNFAGRPPLKIDLLHKHSEMKLSIVNLHMKCCDSGLYRRIEASKMLYDYLDSTINNNSNIIVLGDWNDDLKDEEGEHCFSPFLDDERFIFPTLDITYDLDKASYPKEPYVSFLDHIMITTSFINNKEYIVNTIPMDEYMGGYKNYETYISDHLPVYLSFPF